MQCFSAYRWPRVGKLVFGVLPSRTQPRNLAGRIVSQWLHLPRTPGGSAGRTTECREVPGADGGVTHSSVGSSPLASASQLVVVHQDDLGPHFTLMLSESLRQVQLLKIAFIVTKGRTRVPVAAGKGKGPVLPAALTSLSQESSAQLSAAVANLVHGGGSETILQTTHTHTVFISDSGRVTTNYQPQ